MGEGGSSSRYGVAGFGSLEWIAGAGSVYRADWFNAAALWSLLPSFWSFLMLQLQAQLPKCKYIKPKSSAQSILSLSRSMGSQRLPSRSFLGFHAKLLALTTNGDPLCSILYDEPYTHCLSDACLSSCGLCCFHWWVHVTTVLCCPNKKSWGNRLSSSNPLIY